MYPRKVRIHTREFNFKGQTMNLTDQLDLKELDRLIKTCVLRNGRDSVELHPDDWLRLREAALQAAHLENKPFLTEDNYFVWKGIPIVRAPP